MFVEWRLDSLQDGPEVSGGMVDRAVGAQPGDRLVTLPTVTTQRLPNPAVWKHSIHEFRSLTRHRLNVTNPDQRSGCVFSNNTIKSFLLLLSKSIFIKLLI